RMAATSWRPQGCQGHTEPGLQASWRFHFSGLAESAEKPIQLLHGLIQRILDCRPEFIGGFASDRQADEAGIDRVAPARAPFRRGVNPAERGCRLDQRAAVDEAF